MNSIVVTKLSKTYQINHNANLPYRSLRDELVEFIKKPVLLLKEGGSKKETFYALKNISFTVEEGETIGIIGANGAGKSTLLSILSRIISPTKGEIRMRGKTASLLEVGTGFHPELTGRENIFLNGAVLGMKRSEIKKKFDAIVDFAEVEQFLDTPVKHFSSGMYTRLAFAVAAHLEPEILIVDEVLAVGDVQFQKKSLGKMNSLGAEGRTVIFVSHNMAAINSLCRKSIFLEKGTIKDYGKTSDVVNRYLSSLRGRGSGSVVLTDPKLRRNSLGTSIFKLTRLEITNAKGRHTNFLDLNEPFKIIISGTAEKPLTDFKLGFGMMSALGVPLFNSHSVDDNLPMSYPAGKLTFTVELDPNYLAPGMYSLDVGAKGPGVVDWIPEAASIQISTVGYKDSMILRPDYGGVFIPPTRWLYRLR